MIRERAAVVVYRFRATFARRSKDYLALVGLIGLIGGIAMGSVEAARATQSSYPAYLQKTDASDLTLSTYGIGNAAATNYSPRTAAAIARLPGVRHVESWVGVFAVPLERDGAPDIALSNNVNFAGSKTGLYFNMDRVTAVKGRMANPDRADEFMTTAVGARLMGVHVGQVVPVGLYGPNQANLPGFGTPRVPPAERFEMKLVGIVEFNNEIVQDDTSRLPTNVVYTPAFTRLVPDVDTQGTWYGIQLASHAGGLASVEQALLRVLPPGSVGNFSVTAVTEAKVERAVKPESIALGAFGLIAALAGFGAAMLVIGRAVQSDEEDRRVLRALGAPPLVTAGDALLGVMLAIIAGSLLAAAVGIGLSPLAPLGPIRAVFHPGVAYDWTVLGGGVALFVVTLMGGALWVGWRTAPERSARHGDVGSVRGSRVAQSAAGLGVPLPGVLGMRFALEPGRGRTAVPARSLLVGVVVAVLTATTALTFGDSLRSLVTDPALYGWNWSYALTGQNGVPPQALASLNHARDVQAWSGYSDVDIQIDGQTVPVLVRHGVPKVGPPILSGLDTGDRGVVLGPSTLSQLHKAVGDTVQVSFGTPNTAPLYLPPTPAVIAGTATFPAIAGSSTFAEHPSLGTGALLSDSGLPRSFLKAGEVPDPVLDGPAIVFVRMRPGVAPRAAWAELKHVTAVADQAFAADPNAAGDSVITLGVQRPAEIVNYQSTGNTPEVLAAALAAGAALALALALGATIRRRRRDLALFRTLGFTRRQLALTLLSQAVVTVAVGVAVGIPVGIALGRELWILFAQNIAVVPQPSVPSSVGLVAAGAFLVAVVVSALPGQTAASMPASAVLREE